MEETTPPPTRPDDAFIPRRSLPSEPAADPLAESQFLIEDYLDRACGPLLDVIPYLKRRELRREWREHLEALIEARMELGEDVQAAANAAIRQFGDPQQLGNEWIREWKKAKRRSPDRRRAMGWQVAGSFMVGAMVGPPASILSWMVARSLYVGPIRSSGPEWIMDLISVGSLGLLIGPVAAALHRQLSYGATREKHSIKALLGLIGTLFTFIALLAEIGSSYSFIDTPTVLILYLWWTAVLTAAFYSWGEKALDFFLRIADRFIRAYLSASERAVPE
jgi:hypothetical protein